MHGTARRGGARLGRAGQCKARAVHPHGLRVMSPQFTPHAGEATWHAVARLLDGMAVGDILTYDAIEEATGHSINRSRTHVYRAVRAFEARHQRTVRCRPNVGYEVVPASEHYNLARRQLRLGRRRVRRAEQIAAAANIEDLDPAQRLRLEALTERAANLITLFGRRV